MRKSRQIINNVFFGFLVVSFFCAAAQSQQTASTAQPSREAAILARSFIVASLPEPSDAAATRPDSAAPSENAVTLTNPPLQGQSATITSQGSSPSPFASSDDELHDKKWHYSATGYLWIPGTHRTVGVRGFDASIHVSGNEIFSNFRGGRARLRSTVQIAPVDFCRPAAAVQVGSNRPLPLLGRGQFSRPLPREGADEGAESFSTSVLYHFQCFS